MRRRRMNPGRSTLTNAGTAISAPNLLKVISSDNSSPISARNFRSESQKNPVPAIIVVPVKTDIDDAENHSEIFPVGASDGIVDRREDAEQTAGKPEAHLAAFVPIGKTLRPINRAHDRVV